MPWSKWLRCCHKKPTCRGARCNMGALRLLQRPCLGMAHLQSACERHNGTLRKLDCDGLGPLGTRTHMPSCHIQLLRAAAQRVHESTILVSTPTLGSHPAIHLRTCTVVGLASVLFVACSRSGSSESDPTSSMHDGLHCRGSTSASSMRQCRCLLHARKGPRSRLGPSHQSRPQARLDARGHRGQQLTRSCSATPNLSGVAEGNGRPDEGSWPPCGDRPAQHPGQSSRHWAKATEEQRDFSQVRQV